MTTEVDAPSSDSDPSGSSDFSDISSYADWALKSGIWDGRQVSWTEAFDFHEELKLRLIQLLFESQSEITFNRLAAQLAWIGSTDSRDLLARDIQALDFSNNDLIAQVGLRKSLSKFWKKHKKEILIGAAVVGVATVVVVVAVTTGGAAAGGAVAAGGAALDALKKGGEKPEPSQTVKNDNVTLPTELTFPPSFETLERSCGDHKVLFGEHGVLIDGQYSSYKDILNSSGEHPYLGISPSYLSPPTYQPDLPGNNFPSGLIKPDLYQIPPPPGVGSEKSWLSNTFEIIGRGVVDQEPLNQEPPPLPERATSFRFSTVGNREPHLQIGGINGIDTNYDQARSHANYVANFVPKRSIDWVYNRSRGSVIDLAEVFTLNYAGSSPNTSKLLQERWTAFNQENTDRPNAKYLQFCHSQGAIHVRNALAHSPKEIRNRVIVVAIAPGAVVLSKLCHKSFNYASKNDFVNLGELVYAGALDPSECGTSKLLEMAMDHREELILLDPHPEATGIDHDFQSPTFKEKIKDHIQDYLNSDGEF